jgi:hypothetical protein
MDRGATHIPGRTRMRGTTKVFDGTIFAIDEEMIRKELHLQTSSLFSEFTRSGIL